MKRLLFGLIVLVALAWAAVGPLPADNTPYQQTEYYRQSLASLEGAPLLKDEGQLRFGAAEVDITPPKGHPLAGFGKRRPKGNQGVESRCFARALTLSVGATAVTLVTADMLLANDALVARVLEQTGLTPNQVYFTASHTHSGPGGYAKGLIHERVFGDYDEDYLERLADQIASAVTASRRNLRQGEFAYVAKDLPGRQENRIDRREPTHDQLSLLMFRPIGDDEEPGLTLLAVFGAHATVLGADNQLASADYPGYLVQRLKQRTDAKSVLFASGAVGDARPRGLVGDDDYQQARNFGSALADAVIPEIGKTRWRRELGLASLNLAVDLPPVRISLGTDWSLGPLLTRLVADRKGRIAALRIGDLLLAGFPADYSGHLATALRNSLGSWSRGPKTLVATSFSGGYKGYLVSSHWFYRDAGYETRSVNFFGPWSGDYLNALMLKMALLLFDGVKDGTG